jgi:HPt (histidine-containing phosphotransfer) domain-containing protein
MAGDVELLKKIAEFFREDSVQIMESLRQAVTAGNLKRIQHDSHSLKGMTAHFNAELAVQAASRLEGLAASGDKAQIANAFQKVEQEISKLDATLTIELAKL